MTNVVIRDSLETDYSSIIELNASEVQKTSPVDLDKMRLLASLSSYNKVAVVGGEVAAFLLAVAHGANYKNVNYEWFASRFSSFLYIDRIVVGARFAGLGIGRALYEDLFSYARRHSLGHVTCEYNIDPPNLASKAFHAKFGFEEHGSQWVTGGAKEVSFQVAVV